MTRPLAIAALLLNVTLIGGCAHNPKVQAAGAQQGRAEAALTLPGLPDTCKTEAKRVAVKVGDRPMVLLAEADQEIARLGWVIRYCGSWYLTEVKGRYEE